MKELKGLKTILKSHEREREGMVMSQWYGFIILTNRDHFDLALLFSQQEEPSFPLVDVPDADVRKFSSSPQYP